MMEESFGSRVCLPQKAIEAFNDQYCFRTVPLNLPIAKTVMAESPQSIKGKVVLTALV
jgi:hypothetical protein